MAIISTFTITSVSGNGTTTTYTGSITSGTSPLISGTPIFVSGCTTAGFNGGFVINGGNLTTTITVANSTNHSESESGATAVYNPEVNQVQPSDMSGYEEGYGSQRLSMLMSDNLPLGNITGGIQSITF